MYESGKFADDTNGFNMKTVSANTTKWRNGAVKGLVDHPGRFDALLAAAEKFVPYVHAGTQNDEQQPPGGNPDSDDVFNAVDPSSEPSYDLEDM